MGIGYGKKVGGKLSFFTMQSKRVHLKCWFIDLYVSLFDSIDAKYKKSESVIFERNQNWFKPYEMQFYSLSKLFSQHFSF